MRRRTPLRRASAVTISLALFAALGAVQAAPAADKAAVWVEVQTPHLNVYSDGGAKTARRIATQFEQIRDVFLQVLAHVRVDPPQPILILAARNEKSLAALLPDLYAQKNHVHPTGVFSSGPDRTYIVLRSNVDDEFPYHILFHEYTHLITRLNSPDLPIWLDEGYAEFFGFTRIIGRDVSIGWAPRGRMDFLSHSRLLPLDQLFRVDHHSPYYNEANKANIFYAESWALVHMLILDPQFSKTKMLANYIAAVQSGADPVEAGRRAFGDLSRLERQLEGYIRRGSFAHAELRSPIDKIQKSFTEHTLSRAETDVLLGDYYLDHRYLPQARPLLAEAIRIAPDSAAANDGMALLNMRQGNKAEAQTYFARAIQLQSRSFLTYFYYAENILDRLLPGAMPPIDAQTALQKCVALNPRFAPAYSDLARIYAVRPATLAQALPAARMAVSLAPSAWQAQLTLALVLADNNQFQNARAIARRVAAVPPEPRAANAAANLLAHITQLEQYRAELHSYGAAPTAQPPSPQPLVTLNRRGPTPEPQGASLSGVAPGPAPAPALPAPPAVHLFSMTGSIVAVRCEPAHEALLTLSLGGLQIKLHARDLSKVSFLTKSGAPQAHRLLCSRLRGMAAQVRYTLTAGKPYDGELKSIAPAKVALP